MVLVLARTWRSAARIDRLHRRIGSTRLSLDRHLVKRSSEAARLAEGGLLAEEDANRLRAAASEALAAAEYPLASDALGGLSRQGRGKEAGYQERLLAESRLSQALRECLTPSTRAKIGRDPLAASQLEIIDNATYRARVARNLHNVDVGNVRRLRERPLARFFHLSGRAPLPHYVDLDDE